MSLEDNTPVGDGTVEVTENTTEETTTEQDTEQVEQVLTMDDITIEDLLGITEEDYEEFAEEANHKGMKPLHEWMKHVPEDVRKHIANIRSSYTRKTQEIAQQRRELEEAKTQVLNQRQSVLDNSTVKHFEQHITEEEYDPYTAEGMQAEIKRQAALMLKQMMEPAQQKMQQEIEMERRTMALQQFKQQHPDLVSPEMKMPIAQMLAERPELKLEDAYYIVKSKMDNARTLENADLERTRKSNRKTTLKSTSVGRSVTPSGTPKFRDAWSAYQWHKSQENK
tara:strand:+ start:1059 stop:1901 length:843 start_codon:yes stop_codon:yes gene_type:complete